MSFMLTRTGVLFDLVSPTAGQVRLTDLMHHLSRLCRWTGAVESHYSVAQHSVMGASGIMLGLVPELRTDELRRRVATLFLLHDAHEAYLNDLSSPVKRLLSVDSTLRVLTTRIQAVVHEHFKVSAPDHLELRTVDWIDDAMRTGEYHRFLRPYITAEDRKATDPMFPESDLSQRLLPPTTYGWPYHTAFTAFDQLSRDLGLET